MTTITLPKDVPQAVRADHPSGRSFRADIQGLRALAVTLVLLYHLWPARLPGGFVGVDVFFVISGFLITTHLLDHASKGLRGLGEFWARRAKRLLPASFLVLGATLLASRLVAPETQWGGTARQIGAAALYVVNWLLASSSVDYLAAGDVASPVEHYWSLAVEEQFYLVWPLLVLFFGAVAARAGKSRTGAVVAGLAGFTALSFAYSVYATANEPTAAYFITVTRVWELGLGGVLAAAFVWSRMRGAEAGRLSGPLRSVAVGVGLLGILWSALAYSATTAFPGWAALVPVTCAALVIAAGTGRADESRSIGVLSNPVAGWLGDVSYSVYLWHWPLIALVPFISGGSLGLLDKGAIIVATLVLAALTKVYVEDPLRRPGALSLKQTFVFTAGGMAVVVALSGAQSWEVETRREAARAEVVRALASPAKCLGANALAHHCPSQNSGRFVPALSEATEDRSLIYPDCLLLEPFQGVTACSFGDPDGDVSVAVVGNSHAAHWMGPIDEIAKASGWKVTTFLAASCTPSTVVNSDDQWHFKASAEGCLGWASRVQSRLATGQFDMVVLASSSGGVARGTTTREESMPIWIKGYRKWLRPIVDAGVNVAVIRDTPWGWTTLPGPIPDCIAAHSQNFRECGGPRSVWVREDPLEDAAKRVSSEISVIDMNDFLCSRRFCAPVVGGVLVYQDANHLTNTYTMTMAPYLAGPLTDALVEGVD